MKDLLSKIDNVNIHSFKNLITPVEIKQKLPVTPASSETIHESREVVGNIVQKKDPRRLLILGPCSIHDPASALEYSKMLKELAHEVKDTFVVLMRAYFEKPRTTVGWKGLINDPHLDNSFDINEGLLRARKLLMQITSNGIAVATEALEPISPQYIAELISWTAIGARTTESQTHREMASGLSSPVGFKNNTDGNIEVAINAIKSASMPHHFLGIDEYGKTSIVSTKGNGFGHVILRGGKNGPNFDKDSVKQVEEALAKAKIDSGIVIDCSHDNSSKDFRKQPEVFMNCVEQIAHGNKSIVGFMIESHINEGSQPLTNSLKPGVSITDGCIDFKTSAKIVRAAREILKPRK